LKFEAWAVMNVHNVSLSGFTGSSENLTDFSDA